MKTKERGITLIELLIIIAVVSMLAPMILIQLTTFAFRTESASAIADLRTAATVQEMMKASWGSYGVSQCGTLPGWGGGGPGSILTGPGDPVYPNILSTTDSQGMTRGLEIQLSEGVTFIANTDYFGTTYAMGTKHVNGDTVFATEGDSGAIYMRKSILGAPIFSGDIPQPMPGSFDFDPYAATWTSL